MSVSGFRASDEEPARGTAAAARGYLLSAERQATELSRKRIRTVHVLLSLLMGLGAWGDRADSWLLAGCLRQPIGRTGLQPRKRVQLIT